MRMSLPLLASITEWQLLPLIETDKLCYIYMLIVSHDSENTEPETEWMMETKNTVVCIWRVSPGLDFWFNRCIWDVSLLHRHNILCIKVSNVKAINSHEVQTLGLASARHTDWQLTSSTLVLSKRRPVTHWQANGLQPKLASLRVLWVETTDSDSHRVPLTKRHHMNLQTNTGLPAGTNK